jgi:uncharacterized membrane protein
LSLPLATALVALVSLVTNRVLAVGVGLWLRVPAALLLGFLLFLDIIQIPFFYRLYDHGFSLFDGIPRLRRFINRDCSETAIGKWARPLGGLGVMVVAALPTFGGGIWSATFIAYGVGLKRRASYSWMILGSLLSYLTLYWILDTLIRTIRYFMH